MVSDDYLGVQMMATSGANNSFWVFLFRIIFKFNDEPNDTVMMIVWWAFLAQTFSHELLSLAVHLRSPPSICWYHNNSLQSHCVFVRFLFCLIDNSHKYFFTNWVDSFLVEQPSSSSISTTTSSVTSMTSLEHESNDTSVSASDYGADNWDQENWGDMDVSWCDIWYSRAVYENLSNFRHHRIHHLPWVVHHQQWAQL